AKKDSLNPKALHQPEKMASLDTQELCCRCAISLSPRESPKDDLLPAGVECLSIRQTINGSIWRFGSDYGGEVLQGDSRAPAQDNRPLNHIGQLAYISWPVMSQKPFHGLGSYIGKVFFRLLGKTLDEVMNEGRDILFSFSQSWQLNRDNIEAVVKIVSEASLF